MSVSQRQLFGGNFDSSPYVHNDSMMAYNSFDIAEDMRAVPDQSRQQEVRYDCYFNNQKVTSTKKDDNSLLGKSKTDYMQHSD
jgi:hypothetical protein